MKQNTKFLWMYIAILFSFAIILILFAGLSRNTSNEQQQGMKDNIATLSQKNTELTNKIKHLADEKSVPVSSIVTAALICDSKLNTYAQIGTRKTSRLIDTMSCSDFTLDQNEIDMLKE